MGVARRFDHDRPSFDKSVAYNWQLKRSFLATARNRLRLVAVSMGLDSEKYDLRTNKGGIAVSGEATLHTDHVYVQVFQFAVDQEALVLYRTCNGRQDYCSGMNRYVSANILNAPEKLADLLRPIQLEGELLAFENRQKEGA